MIDAINTALTQLGYTDTSQFTAKSLDDYRYEVFLEGEYFGIFDMRRQTFVD